ncbi:glycosyltransferase, partial [Mycoplasmoides pirum]
TYTKNLINIFTKNNYFVYEINVYSEKKNLFCSSNGNYEFVHTKYFENLNLKKDLNNKKTRNLFKRFFIFFKLYLCEIKNAFFIKKFIRLHNIDIVINNNFSTPIWFNKFSKYIWIQHFDSQVYLLSFWNKILRKFLFINNPLKYPNIVFFTKKDFDYFLSKKMINNKKTNSFYISPSIPRDKNLNFKNFNNKTQITYIGRLENKQKNINFLNEIVYLSLKKEKKINIDVYGSGEDEYLITKNNYINYHGYFKNDEIEKILDETKILLLPSNFEGFPLVIVEALSNGVPCIISNTYLNASYLINDERGAIINNFNPEEWIDKIYTILNLDETQYKKLSNSCISFAKENLSFEVFENKWLNLLKNI